jgi:NADH:ubiquinone oxidoreductase subunit H
LIKIIILLFGMIWVRHLCAPADRLMAFGWKVMLPLALAIVFITGSAFYWHRSWATDLSHGIPRLDRGG